MLIKIKIKFNGHTNKVNNYQNCLYKQFSINIPKQTTYD